MKGKTRSIETDKQDKAIEDYFKNKTLKQHAQNFLAKQDRLGISNLNKLFNKLLETGLDDNNIQSIKLLLDTAKDSDKIPVSNTTNNIVIVDKDLEEIGNRFDNIINKSNKTKDTIETTGTIETSQTIIETNGTIETSKTIEPKDTTETIEPIKSGKTTETDKTSKTIGQDFWD